jgi:pimeloyl-ACP methyl ester carboxylesterase
MADDGALVRLIVALILAFIVGVSMYLAVFSWCYYAVLFDPSRRPLPPGALVADRAGDRGAHQVWIDVGPHGDRVHAVYAPAPASRRRRRAPTLLFFHGRNGSVADHLYSLRLARALGAGLLMPDYRGFGLSSNATPTLGTLERDGQACAAWLRDVARVPEADTVVWGESLGGAAACAVARHRPLMGLVLYGTFSSLRDLADDCAHVGARFAADIVTDVLIGGPRPSGSPRQCLRDAACPVVILHCRDDRLIPFVNAARNADAARESASPRARCLLLPLEGSHAAPAFTAATMQAVTRGLGLADRRPLRRGNPVIAPL